MLLDKSSCALLRHLIGIQEPETIMAISKCSVTIDVRPEKPKRRFPDMIRVPPLTKKGIFS
ncbi:hypothetical protein HO542_01715 [Streptococcus suis]|nr:hypothetical protein [Streptococcus suis]